MSPTRRLTRLLRPDSATPSSTRLPPIDNRDRFVRPASGVMSSTRLIDVPVVLYGESVRAEGVVLLALTLITATCGLAAVGTLYGGLAAGYKGRETLLPLLTLPAVAPVLIGATRAVEAALGTAGAAVSDGWQWVSLLAVFAVAFGVGGSLAFGPLIDE